MKKYVLILLALFTTAMCWSQNGTLIAGFDNGGFILTPPQLALEPVQSFAKQCFIREDNKIDIVVFGNKTQITRHLSNGQLDSTYAYKGYSEVVSMVPTCAAIQQDGKIVVGGSTNGEGNFMVARYQINGDLDSSFGNEGVMITDSGAAPKFLNAIAISPAGKIIVGGSNENMNVSQFIVIQFTADGILDASFGAGGIVTTGFNGNSASIASLAIQSDGKIVAAGSVYGSSRDFALARYNSDGSLDLNMNGIGFESTDFGYDDAAQSVLIDGEKIYVGGFSSDASGFQHFRISRYKSDGSNDTSYNGGSVLAYFGDSHDVLTSIKLQLDGKMIAAGRTDLFSSNNDIALVRINSDGSLDSSFGSLRDGLAVADLNGRADESVYLTIQPDGKILTGGDSEDYNTIGVSLFTCFRFNTDGTLDRGFGTNGILGDGILSIYDSYNSLLAQSGGNVTAISNIASGNTSDNFANRFKPNGTPDSLFGQNGVKEIEDSAAIVYFQPDGKFLAINFTAPGQIIRYNPDGSLDASFGTAGSVQIPYGGFPAFQSDGKIVLGSSISTSDNKTHFQIKRFNADGSLDQTFGNAGFTQFNADTIDNLNSISIAPDGKIIVGGTGYIFPPDFSLFQSEVLVLRLNTNGTPDNSFGDGGLVRVFRGNEDFIGSALAQNDNKVVLTYYIDDNSTGHTNIFLERLNTIGTIDRGFAQNGQTSCDGGNFVLQTDQKIVVSGIQVNSQNNEDFSLTRFNVDGHVDSSFGSNGKVISSFTGVDNILSSMSLSGDSLFVGGSGVNKTGATFSILAEFLLESASAVNCPANKVVSTDSNKCSAVVTGIDPTFDQTGQLVGYELSGATIDNGNGSASGKTFNKGVTTVTYALANDKTKTCSFTVTVEDKQVPAISSFSVSPVTLWPPDHEMRDVTVNYSLSDNCGIDSVTLSVTSNEPVQSNEKGDRSPDWKILDDHHIRLRSESLAGGNGRTYTITITATDVSGNKSVATATVNVQKSKGNPGCNLQLKAAPNPSHNYFLVWINSNCPDKIKVRLLDNRGKVLTTFDNLTAPQILKFGEGLHPGVYFVEVTQSGKIKSLQLVKL